MLDKFPEEILKNTDIVFSVDTFGLYAIYITARCKSSEQSESHENETLRVEIDDLKLREIPPLDKPQYNKIPPAWNGTELKNLAKTVTFIVTLNAGEHVLHFYPTPEAVIERWSCQLIENTRDIFFNLDDTAEEGDKRPWYTFALVDIPLDTLTAEASVSWHFLDGDDIKLIVDGEIETNTASKLWRNWIWSARPWQILTGPKRDTKTFVKHLPRNIHYVEFWADKTPILHKVTFDLGSFQPKRIPTVDDPRWTSDFADDTETMLLARLIFAEARNQTKEAMLGVGWVITNRLHANRSYFGHSYHEIILKNSVGIYQFASFNPDEKRNFPILADPLTNTDKITQQAWFDSYDIAKSVIEGINPDPTNGATFFHSSDLSQKVFITEYVPGAVFTKQIGDFLFYRDPNDK